MTHFTDKSKQGYQYRSGKEGPVIQIRVEYTSGFSLSSRGVWFRLDPIVVTERGGYSMGLSSGVALMLAPLERFKPKTVLSMAERIDPIVPAIVAAWGPEPTENGDGAAVLALVRSAFSLEVAR